MSEVSGVTMSEVSGVSKAFDTLNHTIMLRKLYHYGIRGVTLEWFTSYLTNRRQFVSIDRAHQ